MTIEQAFEIGLQHHQSGRLAEAEAIYRQVLAVEPCHAGALRLLAIIAHQMNRNDDAAELLRQAIAISPQDAVAFDTLGTVLKALGSVDDAIAAHRQAIALAPGYPDAHFNLGNCLCAAGRFDEAAMSYRQCIALRPVDFQAHVHLAIVLKETGHLADAIAAYIRAVDINPGVAEVHFTLGLAFNESGQIDNAIAAFRQAIALKPDYAQAYNNLGNALGARCHRVEAIEALSRAVALSPEYAEGFYNLGIALGAAGQLEEAASAYRRAIALKPELPEAHNNLGVALSEDGHLDAAIAAYHQAIQLKPDYVEAHANIGTAWYRQGLVDEAIAAYEHALRLKPDSWGVNCNLVSTLHARPGLDALEIRAAHELWNQRYAAPFAPSHQPHANDRNPERRLRVGYVSPDFRHHSVAQFIEELLAHHDPERVEVYCYSSVICPDPVTARLRQITPVWRDVIALQDAELAEWVREDRIDILVDLAGHTANNRLLVFARKPAPVQVTWLGYPDTTGMRVMDYRLTDAFADPPGSTEHLHSEELIRLPDCAWCFRPSDDAPAVSGSPFSATGHITFGCFNAQYKFNLPLLKLWSEILLAVPGSRLLLKNSGLKDPSTRERMQAALEKFGIAPERIELSAQLPTIREHLATYARVDIALDTFPYHGTTTTCEALWMGVPVVSMAGKTHVSRVGVSLLSNTGLPELIAADESEYVRIAAQLAKDPSRLAGLRAGLRARLAASPLMDAPRFARKVEAAYREMWRKWCGAGR